MTRLTVPRAALALACVGGLVGAGCRHLPARIAPPAGLEAAIASLDAGNDAAVLVGAGDIASCEAPAGAAATAALVRNVLARHPEAAVFTTGDHAYPDGSAEQFRECYAPFWGEFNPVTVPTPGNHDYRTPLAGAYFDYFDVFAARPGARPTGYYSFRHGAWRVVVLNSLLAVEPGSVQLRWLERTLDATPQHCVAAIWHHPLRSSGYHGYLPWDAGRETVAFWRVLLRHGGRIVLNGHDHVYERFAPLGADGRPRADGLRQFTVGTGGAWLHPVILRRAHSQHLRNDTYGVLIVLLGPDGYEWAYVGTDGAIHDRGVEQVECARPAS